MLTEQQLEQAARMLCEIRGISPDKITHAVAPDEYGLLFHAPAWKFAANEIRQHEQIEFALRQVTDTIKGAE